MTPTQATATPDQLLPCACHDAMKDVVDVLSKAVLAFDSVLSYPEFDCDNASEPRPLCRLVSEALEECIAAIAAIAAIRRSSVPTPMSDSNDAIKADWDRVMSGLAPMSDSTVAAAGGDERAAFEAAMKPKSYACRWEDASGNIEAGYCSAPTHHAWEGWQARASLSATGVPTQPSDIPARVYWAPLADNFYSAEGGGMGLDFYRKWKPRRAEFPQGEAFGFGKGSAHNPFATPSPAPAVAAITERQDSVHPAAPSSPSALRAAPFSEPSACESSELPVRLKS